MSKSLFKAAFTVGAGALFEAGDWLKQQVADWEADQGDSRTLVIVPDENDARQTRQVATGLARGATRAAGRGLRTARQVAQTAGSLAVISANAAGSSRLLAPLAPLRQEMAGLERRAAAQVENWGRAGQEEIDRSRALARQVLGRGVSAAALILSENPGVHNLIHDQVERAHREPAFQRQIDQLVRLLAGNYLAHLQEHPDEIDALVRDRVAVYLAHLEEAPHQIETLVRAQANAYLQHLIEEPQQVETLIRDQADAYIAYLLENSDSVEALVRAQADAYMAHLLENPHRAEALVRAQAAAYVAYVAANPEQVDALVRGQADGYIAHLLDNPDQLEALVRAQANIYVDYLADTPAQVEALVRVQADNYIDHLSDNPEQVQDLVRGQSAGLANEVTNEMRGRLTTADSALETVLRRMLRRPARADLPEPPPEVQALAGPRLVYGREEAPSTNRGDEAYE